MSENDVTAPDPGSAEDIHERPPLPPPTFEFLVMSIATQAQMQLGLFHFGAEKDAPEPDLQMAKHSIDLLGVIQEKTKGNLALEEERLLNNSLTELRFRFVQASSVLAKP
jgi:hypothetical protein